MAAQRFRLPASLRLVTVAALLVASVTAASAQSPAGSAQGTIPGGRVAIINIAAFQSDILELSRKITEINARFEPRTKELLALRDTIQGIEQQVQAGTVSPAQAPALRERYDSLKREYDRKVEDMKFEAQKAFAASAEPIEEKVRQSLTAYAAQRGIVLVMEIGGSQKIGSIIYAAPGLDITKDFVAQYNKANP